MIRLILMCIIYIISFNNLFGQNTVTLEKGEGGGVLAINNTKGTNCFDDKNITKQECNNFTYTFHNKTDEELIIEEWGGENNISIQLGKDKKLKFDFNRTDENDFEVQYNDKTDTLNRPQIRFLTINGASVEIKSTPSSTASPNVEFPDLNISLPILTEAETSDPSDSELIVDVTNRRTRFGKKLKYLSPGENIHVKIENYNPYRDNVTFESVSEVYNPDAAERITEVIIPIIDSSSGSRGPGTGNSRIIIQKLTHIANQLQAFYDEVYHSNAINIKKLEEENLPAIKSFLRGDMLKISGEVSALTITNAVANLSKDLDAESKTEVQTILKQILDVYNKIFNYKRIPVPLSFDIGGDYTSITIQMFRDNELVASSPKTFEIPTAWNLGLDYSVGVLSTNLVDFEYQWKRLEGRVQKISLDANGMLDTTYVRQDSLVQLVPNEKSLKPMALGHIYMNIPVLNGYLRPALSFGIGIDDDIEKVPFLIGGSVLLGKKFKIGVTYGSLWTKVERLDRSYSLGEVINISDDNMTPTLTPFKKLKRSSFWGFSVSIPVGQNDES